MKGFTIFIILAALAIIGFLVLRNPNQANAPTPETSDEMTTDNDSSINSNFSGTKEINAESSNATWTGSKTLIKDYYDSGTIKVKSGNAVFDKGLLTGGEIVFDMNSIATLSTGNGNEEQALSSQAKHMKSADFFDAEKYPEAKFVINSAAKESGIVYLLTGDLTIKGETHPISFPVEVTEENGLAEVSGTATIDRTVWNIKYGSSKFFPDLGDKVIGDEFTLEFKVVTK